MARRKKPLDAILNARTGGTGLPQGMVPRVVKPVGGQEAGDYGDAAARMRKAAVAHEVGRAVGKGENAAVKATKVKTPKATFGAYTNTTKDSPRSGERFNVVTRNGTRYHKYEDGQLVADAKRGSSPRAPAPRAPASNSRPKSGPTVVAHVPAGNPPAGVMPAPRARGWGANAAGRRPGLEQLIERVMRERDKGKRKARAVSTTRRVV